MNDIFRQNVVNSIIVVESQYLNIFICLYFIILLSKYCYKLCIYIYIYIVKKYMFLFQIHNNFLNYTQFKY